MTTTLLHEEVQRAAESLRTALRTLIEDAGCNPLKPQAVHRHIGVDRVLCWKVSRLIRLERIEEALLQLPGEEALSIFVTAFEPTTASPARIDTARAAIAGLNRAIAQHVGDRRTLQLMLDSVPGGQDALAQSRKLLFRGASGLWGIQARERLQVLMLAPNADRPDMIDSVIATGWVDVKRMRPDARWRLMKFGQLPDPGHPGRVQVEPLDREAGQTGPENMDLLLHKFCADMPALSAHEESDGFTYYEIGPSATGRVGAFSIFLGLVHRCDGPRHVGPSGDRLEFAVNLLAPAEHMTYDVLLHRDLRLHDHAELAFYSAAFNLGTRFSDFNRLPIEAEAAELEGDALFENRHYGRHRELVELMVERTGWRPDDFVALRYEVDYPPFPSVATFSAPLEPR